MRAISILLCSVVVVGTQTQIRSIRWWCSPSIVASVAITKPQVAAIARQYEENLPAQTRTTEEVIGLMDEVARRMREGAYDDGTLRATERLASAQLKQRDLQHRALKQAVEILTRRQRQKLADLIAEKREALSIAWLLATIMIVCFRVDKRLRVAEARSTDIDAKGLELALKP